jgi:hypothetical protein
MALILEVKVLFVALVAGSDSRRQLRRREAAWEGTARSAPAGAKLEAKCGADVQEPDTRPLRVGNPAEYGDAR